MKMHLLAITAAVTLGACSRNPDPEYAPASDDAPAATTVTVAPTTSTPDVDAPAVVAEAPATPRLSDEETMRLGREAAQLIFANDIETLWPRFDAAVQAQAQSPENFGNIVGQIFGQIGQEMNVVEEEIIAPAEQPGLSVYRRRGHYMAIGQDANLMIAFNADGTIAGFNIQPAQ